MAPRHGDTPNIKSLFGPSSPLLVKLMVRILVPLFVIFILFAATLGHLELTNQEEEIDNDVKAFTISLSRVVDDLMWRFQTEELVSTLAIVSSNPALRGAEVYTTENKLFVRYGQTTGEDGEIMRTMSHPVFKRNPDGSREDLGTLVVYYSYTEAQRQFQNHLIVQAVRLALYFVVVILAVIYAYHTTIGKPLRSLLHSIRATADRNRWIPAKWESDDEIGHVIRAYNRLIRQVGEKDLALTESEKQYRELFENAQVGIFQTRNDGTLWNANQTLARLMGFPDVKTIMKANSLEQYVRPEDHTRLWEVLRAEGGVHYWRTQLKKGDGTPIWVEISGQLNPDGSFNGILLDVTEQVEARKAMEDRDELHRAFFEENKAVMLLHDPLDSTIQFVNPAACQYYGYTEEELTSKTLYDLNCMSESDVFEELSKAAAERRHYFNHVHTLKDGTKRNVEVYTGPVSLGKRQLHYSIIHDVTERKRLENKLERMATRDQLTGAYNRHAFFARAKEEVARSVRFGHPMAMLMFDLDRFKEVNDTYGHAIGDEVLRIFALRCRADLRQSDIFARLGGEEFAALLVETPEDKALEVAERIRSIAEAQPIPTESGKLTVTTSIGVTAFDEDDSVTDMLKRADKGLYEAKETGRNKVIKA